MSQKEKGQAEETRWRDARQAALTGDFASIPDDCILGIKVHLSVFAERTLKRPDDLAPSQTYGVWIWDRQAQASHTRLEQSMETCI